MRMPILMVSAAAFLISGAVAADEDSLESTPVELSAAQMDQITAGSLQLPNGKVQFANFDNPAPDLVANFCDGSGLFCHPALTRRSATASNPDGTGATAGHGPSVDGAGNDGPWAATVGSPVITCVGFSIPAGLGPGPRLGSGCSP